MSKGHLPILKELPLPARTAHGFKNLSTNLISVGQLCDSDCTAIFKKQNCAIIHNKKVILKGTRNKRTGLWYVLLITSEGEKVLTSEGEQNSKLSGEHCNNVHRLNKITDILNYIYASLFSPTKSTLLQAIKNKNLITFPGLTYKNAKRYLKETIAIAKGHLENIERTQGQLK